MVVSCIRVLLNSSSFCNAVQTQKISACVRANLVFLPDQINLASFICLNMRDGGEFMLSCASCHHSFIEHDDSGCKHSACQCKVNQTDFIAGKWNVDPRIISVRRQVVYVFIPILNFYAFYKIQKLRKQLLYVYLPSFTTSVILDMLLKQISLPPGFPVIVFNIMQAAAFTLFEIYLVVIWTKRWNDQFTASSSMK